LWIDKFIFHDIDKRDFDGSNQIVPRKPISIPNFQNDVFSLIWNSSPYFESLVPLWIQTANNLTVHLIT
jgi:hypothetical protein